MTHWFEKYKLFNRLSSRLFLHVYFWSVVGGLAIFQYSRIPGFFKSLPFFILFLLTLPTLVYLHFYLLETLFKPKRYLFYVLVLVLLVILSAHWIRFCLGKEFLTYNRFFASVVHCLLLVIVTTGLKFLVSGFKQRLEFQLARSEMLHGELKRLRTHVVPDSIKNTIAYLRQLSLAEPEKVPSQILAFSSEMRARLKSQPMDSDVVLNDGHKKWEDTLSLGKRGKILRPLLTPVAFHLYYWAFITLAFIINSSQTLSALHLYRFCFFFILPLPADVHFYLLHQFYNRKSYMLYVFFLIVQVTAFALLTDYVFGLIFDRPSDWVQWLIDFTMTIIVLTFVKAVGDGFKRQVRLQEIKAVQLQTELTLLKSQVNPHFLFNTLNNLYGLSLEQSPHLPHLLGKLEELIGYMQESAKQKTAPLDWEKEFIQSYLELEKIRLSGQVDIQFECHGSLAGKRIAPMLLIPFVENIFKHGIEAGGGFWARITLEVAGDTLRFLVENSKPNTPSTGPKPFPSKIGLKNVRRRLELVYPNRYHLQIHDQEKHEFKVQLEIIL